MLATAIPERRQGELIVDQAYPAQIRQIPILPPSECEKKIRTKRIASAFFFRAEIILILHFHKSMAVQLGQGT